MAVQLFYKDQKISENLLLVNLLNLLLKYSHCVCFLQNTSVIAGYQKRLKLMNKKRIISRCIITTIDSCHFTFVSSTMGD